MSETIDNIEYTEGSENVFVDLGFAEPEVELAKAEFCRAISQEIHARKLSQAQAARILGIDQPRVSLLMRGRTEDFSMDRLLELLRKFGYAVHIELSKPAAHVTRGMTVALAIP